MPLGLWQMLSVHNKWVGHKQTLHCKAIVCLHHCWRVHLIRHTVIYESLRTQNAFTALMIALKVKFNSVSRSFLKKMLVRFTILRQVVRITKIKENLMKFKYLKYIQGKICYTHNKVDFMPFTLLFEFSKNSKRRLRYSFLKSVTYLMQCKCNAPEQIWLEFSAELTNDVLLGSTVTICSSLLLAKLTSKIWCSLSWNASWES